MLNNWQAVSTLDRFVDDVMGAMVGTATTKRAFDPSIDVRADDREVCLVCDVPGVKREDLEISLEDHVLTISGTRKYEAHEDRQVVLGRSYGSFTRRFTLPTYLDEEKMTAELADGVLSIRIGKHEKAKPRKIEIGTSAGPKKLNE